MEPQRPDPTDVTLRAVVMWSGGSARCVLPRVGVVTVGRDAGCELSVDYRSVSRRHVRLDIDGVVHLTDLGSANGTRIGGRKLAAGERVLVEPGTLIELAGALLVLHAGPGLVASTASIASRAASAGEARSMREVERLVDHVARSDISVVLLGETGVGKEVVAEEIHRRSPRARAAMIKLNCAALPETLLEAELFGYERGAFTGAVQPKPGLVEAAEGGTLFLDEIGEMPLATQAKLLRMVENREVQRVGSLKPRAVNVRFVAATHRDLEALVGAAAFRKDLYYRLNGVCISIPPLRERAAEVPGLAEGFLRRAAAQSGHARAAISPDAMALLVAYAWPGNVRELRNVIERALVFCTDELIDVPHLPPEVRRAVKPAPAMREPAPATREAPPVAPPRAQGDALWTELEAIERQRIVDALTELGGNQTKVAAALGISRRTLLRRLDQFDLARPRKRR